MRAVYQFVYLSVRSHISKTNTAELRYVFRVCCVAIRRILLDFGITIFLSQNGPYGASCVSSGDRLARHNCCINSNQILLNDRDRQVLRILDCRLRTGDEVCYLQLPCSDATVTMVFAGFATGVREVAGKPEFATPAARRRRRRSPADGVDRGPVQGSDRAARPADARHLYRRLQQDVAVVVVVVVDVIVCSSSSSRRRRCRCSNVRFSRLQGPVALK